MTWRTLPLSAGAGAHLPPLLISATLTSDEFAIQVTDLATIWSETLDKSAIIRRAREEVTTINPADSDQFPIFIEKIQQGLSGAEDTTLTLTILNETSRPSLVLHVTTNLPDGFAALEWPIRLSPAPPGHLTSQLVKPLLEAQHARMLETSHLVETLKDKDHVIQKLLDKLENQGTELQTVFPQLGKGGRKVDRKTAAARVKGLAKFEIKAWRHNLDHRDGTNIRKLITEAFGDGAETLDLIPGAQEQDDVEEWWDEIKGLTVNLSTGKISTKGPSKSLKKPVAQSKPSLERKELTLEEDAFQIQATPPRSSAVPKVPDDSTTDDDDDDLDVPSQRSTQRSKIPDSFPRSPSPPRRAPTPNPAKKLGIVGSKKSPPKAPSPVTADNETTDMSEEDPVPMSKPAKSTAPPPEEQDKDTEVEEEVFSSPPKARSPIPPAKVLPKPVKGKLGKVGGKTAATPPPAQDTGTDTEEDAPPPREPTPPPVLTKPKKKLGMVGGKKKANPSPATESTPAPDTDTTTTTPTKAGRKRKLGMVGGGNKSSPAKAVKHEPASQSSATLGHISGDGEDVAEEEKIEETEEQKADRRRHELKRELEQKAKAPVKKKRRF